MAQGPRATNTIFSFEELSPFFQQIQDRKPHSIDIACGCTSKTYGDSLGILHISDDGNIRVTCQCYEACNLELVYPIEFAKHASGTRNVPNWKTKIWILNCDGEKVKLEKTCLLKYYKGDEYKRPRHQVSHRDEFLRCSRCMKMRRFELRSGVACRFYHDAALNENRTCSDMIPGRWTCDDLEERESTRKRSGCRKKTNCKGCNFCVCFGCEMCKFEDCICQACSEFYANAPK